MASKINARIVPPRNDEGYGTTGYTHTVTDHDSEHPLWPVIADSSLKTFIEPLSVCFRQIYCGEHAMLNPHHPPHHLKASWTVVLLARLTAKGFYQHNASHIFHHEPSEDEIREVLPKLITSLRGQIAQYRRAASKS